MYIYIYTQCIPDTFGREMTKYTSIYGAYIRLWPTLLTVAAQPELLCNFLYCNSCSRSTLR